jgi:queuosine biosynthesis protein QueC
MKKEKAVLILSGGMDSTTLLYDLIDKKYEVYPISFFYGQRHKREIEYARRTLEKLNLLDRWIGYPLIALGKMGGSSLTDPRMSVPEGHYSAENMKDTVVPMRNAVLLSLGCAHARVLGINKVFYGAHFGDHLIYWDCRKRFLDAFNNLIFDQASNDDRGSLTPEYIRGFFEGEGCFTYSNYKQIQYHRKTGERIGTCNPKVIPLVIITQKEKEILEEIKKFFYGRGTVYPAHNKRCYSYKLQHQDCRMVIDLMKGNFKTKHKEEQFRVWYEKFKDMFEREIDRDNPAIKDKKYTIVQEGVQVIAPYWNLTKGQIVTIGTELKVDYSLTWTCYKGKALACGKCGSCQERLEAFAINNTKDPLDYETT